MKSGLMYNGKTIQDVEHLTYLDETFDVVTSTEVFEHVADDERGFIQVLRVLKKGCTLIFTVPFEQIIETTTTRAYRNEKNEIVQLLEPKYHGDYMGEGILAFRNYGLDLLDKLKRVGFATAELIDVKTQSDMNTFAFKCTKGA